MSDPAGRPDDRRDEILAGDDRSPRRWPTLVLGIVVVVGLTVALLTDRRHGSRQDTTTPPSATQDTFVPAPGATAQAALPPPPPGTACSPCDSVVAGAVSPGPAGLRIALTGRTIRVLDAATGHVGPGPEVPLRGDDTITDLRRVGSGWIVLVTRQDWSPTGRAYLVRAGRARLLGTADALAGSGLTVWLWTDAAAAVPGSAIEFDAAGRVLHRLTLEGAQQLVGATADRAIISTNGDAGEAADGPAVERLVLRDPAGRVDDQVFPNVYCPIATGDSQVAWSSLSGKISVYDEHTGATRSYSAPRNYGELCYGSFSPDGRRLVVGSHGGIGGVTARADFLGRLFAVDLRSGNVEVVPGIAAAPKQSVALTWSAGGDLVAAVPQATSGRLAVWDPVSRRTTLPPVRPSTALDVASWSAVAVESG